MPLFKLKQKVRILSGQKADGRYNTGIVVGVVILQDKDYLGYMTEKEFMSRFDGSRARYTVAYIDCFTEKACVEEFQQKELEILT